ncbi:MAG: TatD family hydrolase, partial [Lentisphaeraceae bacterium]|nr:TatD family hydrolase [Lentisphaeraceae bacterium]
MMIDIGVNLINKSFDRDRAEVIERARVAGVEKIILTGTSVESSRAQLELAQGYPGLLYSTAGIHPHDALGFRESSLLELKQLLSSPEVIAVGEC